MKFARYFLSVILVFTFGLGATGCMNREAPALAKEGNNRVINAQAAIKDLKENCGIDLAPNQDDKTTATQAKTFNWSKLSPEQHRATVTKLKNHIANVKRILEITNAKKMVVNGDTEWLRKSASTAQLYLNSAG